MRLYSKVECPFCWKVKLGLDYLHIPYELVEWNVTNKALLLEYSPQGTAPVLLDEGYAVWDSIVMMFYMDDIAGPGSTLLPGTETERASARQLEIYSSAFVGRSLREIVFEKRSNPEKEWDWDRIHAGNKAWQESQAWLEGVHEGGGTFLKAGFSVADCALLPRFILAERYGVGVIEKYPKLYRWYQYWKDQSLVRNTVPW